MSNYVKQHIMDNGRHVGGRMFSKEGKNLSWLLDLRPTLLDRQCLEAIASAFWKRYEAEPPFQIGTIETAAIPLLTALILHAPPSRGVVTGFVVRKERKTVGLGNSIEGTLTEAPVILIDDTLNSGNAISKAFAVLEAEGRSVNRLFVVIDFNSNAGLRWRKSQSIVVDSLFSLDDFSLKLKNRSSKLPESYRVLWHTKVPGGVPFHVVPKSAPLLEGDFIFRGSDRGNMQAFNAQSGEIVWSFKAKNAAPNKGIWSTPAIHADRIYFGAYNGCVYCLNSKTGEEIWSRSHCEWIGSSPLIVPHLGLLYIGLEYQRPWAQGGLAALRIEDGEKVWEHTISRFQHGSAAYWESGNLVIWGSADHEIVALDAITGQVSWALSTLRSVKSTPAIDQKHNIAAFGSLDMNIYVADLTSGRLMSKWETEGICYTTPLLYEHKVFCGSADRRMYIGSIAQGKIIKTIDVGARVFSSPQLVSKNVMFGTNGGKLMEIDAQSFEVQTVTQLPDAITNAVAVSPDGSRIYVSTAMNHLFALERA